MIRAALICLGLVPVCFMLTLLVGYLGLSDDNVEFPMFVVLSAGEIVCRVLLIASCVLGVIGLLQWIF